MRETQFIRQNKEKWQSFERILEQAQPSPKQLKDVYIQVTDDLSYARTFYPNRSVRVYLNSLSKNVYNKINAKKKTKKEKLFSFWSDELPRLVYESKHAFRLSLFVFVGAMLIGAFSSAMDPEFVRTILGDYYVDMTLDNIADGDPMRVYKESKELGMSVGITFNNLMVSFLTFLMGMFYLIGTIGILISNGVMVGSFQYFFYEQGFLLESFLTIWMHGALEISSIVIAGAAGITMGRGLVFPGTYSRAKAFQISAKRGLKIMVGITPIFIIAGFIEGFVTRHTEIPNPIRAIFICSCFAFIIWYFVIYPYWKNRKGFKDDDNIQKLAADNQHEIRYLQIKNSGQLFNETFLFFSRFLGKIWLMAVVLSLIFTLCNTIVMKVDLVEIFNFELHPLLKLSEIPQMLYNSQAQWIYLVNIILFSVIIIYACLLFERKAIKSGGVESVDGGMLINVSRLVGVVIVAVLTLGIFSINNQILLFIVPFVFSFLMLWLYSSFRGERNIFGAFRETWSMYFSNFAKIIGLTLSIWVLFAFLYSFLQASLFWFLVEMVAWNIDLPQKDMNTLVNSAFLFFGHLSLVLIYVLNIFGFGLAYYSLKEESEGLRMKEQIDEISFDNKIRGIAKEI